MHADYVHGYGPKEAARLVDQAATLTKLLHSDTSYPAGSRVLEVGCGIGAQTLILAQNSPKAQVLSVDIAEESLVVARARVAQAGLTNVTFQQADIFHLPFGMNSFDHVFSCFVLEHLPNPKEALARLLHVLRPGGTLTAIEGDHGSAYFHPDSPAAQRTIQCLVELQARAGGNALIGRQLYPLLQAAGLQQVQVSPRMVYADSSQPDLVEGFTKNTFTAMVAGVRERALAARLIDAPTWNQGVADLYRTAEADGTFCYTFFKAVGRKR